MQTRVSTVETEPKLSSSCTLTKSTKLGIPCRRPIEIHIDLNFFCTISHYIHHQNNLYTSFTYYSRSMIKE